MTDMKEIEKLWKEMARELRKKDPHDDWPCKGIVMHSPWTLQVHAYPEAFEDHETVLDFVREKAVRPEEFDGSSLPPELLAIVKEECPGEKYYPNAVFAETSGKTLEEAIGKMRLKLRLLDYGYILMDQPFYEAEILDDENGAWMLEEDDDEFSFELDDQDFEDDDDEEDDGKDD